MMPLRCRIWLGVRERGRARSLGLSSALLQIALPSSGKTVNVIASAFELMQRPITLTNTLPFCAVAGGMLGALWDYVRNPKAGFPTTPSLRGAMLGALFSVCLIGFGSNVDALKAAGPHGHVPNIIPPVLVRIVGLVGLVAIAFGISTMPRNKFWPIETASGDQDSEVEAMKH
jgi:hypothetical protein